MTDRKAAAASANGAPTPASTTSSAGPDHQAAAATGQKPALSARPARERAVTPAGIAPESADTTDTADETDTAHERPAPPAPAAQVPADAAATTSAAPDALLHQAAALGWTGHWIVDPGRAKQSQDWVYAGPSRRPGGRRPAPLRSSWWPAGLPAAGAALCAALALVSGGARLLRGPAPDALFGAPLAAGLLLAALLYAGVAGTRLVRSGRRRRARRPRLDAPAPGDNAATFDPTMTYTEGAQDDAAVETLERPGTERALGAGEELDLSDEDTAGRLAWEDQVDTAAPDAWPDRPLVLAIGDGVSAGVRSSEMSRLATQTAWQRTFYHLHALATGAPPALREPWSSAPGGWPAPGPERDRLLAQAMSRAFADANAQVVLAGREIRQQNPAERRATATTLSLLAFDGPRYARYSLVHVGDCSVYHVHAATGEAEPRQVEHNKAAAYAQGDPGRHAEARRQGLHNVLTRWVGMTSNWAALNPQVLTPPGEALPGDAFVLCSDGLDKHVTPESIARAALHLDAPAAARWLVDLANYRGGSDHIAVVVLQSGDEHRARGVAPRWTLWREAAAAALSARRGEVLNLALAGAAVAVLSSVSVLGGAALRDVALSPALATPTALPTASPLAVPPAAAATAPPAAAAPLAATSLAVAAGAPMATMAAAATVPTTGGTGGTGGTGANTEQASQLGQADQADSRVPTEGG
jgi:serine/threonine protein phosphatase PrpC